MTVNFSYVPRIDSNESIYSWCAFLFTANSKTSSVKTVTEILGFEYALLQFDLPTRLDFLIDNFHDAVPEIDELLRKHTLAGFFWPFLSEFDRNRIKDSLLNITNTRARQPLLQSTTKLNVHRYLRWCPMCVDEDVDQIGRPTWKTQHLFPTYIACVKHRTWLMVAQKRFKRLVLPLDMEIKQVSEFQACNDSPHLSTALLISSVTEFVQSCESIDANLIRNATLRKLYGLGVLLPNSLFAFENILNWFKTSKVGEFCSAGICNPFTALADGKWIRVLLWKNGMSNAIRWTVLWCSFDWKSSSDAIFTLQQALQDLQHDHLGQQLMFTSNEDHARAPEKIWKALEDAKTLYQAVEMLGMPKSWLQYWLQKDRDLVKHWQDHIDRAQVSEISTRIHSFLSNNPDVSSSKLRELFQSDLVILRRKAPDLHQIYNSVAQSRNKNTQIRLV